MAISREPLVSISADVKLESSRFLSLRAMSSGRRALVAGQVALAASAEAQLGFRARELGR